MTKNIWKPRKIPLSQWLIKFERGIKGDFIAVAAHVNGPQPGGLYWTKVEIPEFPNDLFSLNNFKDFIMDAVKKNGNQ